jgi:hypothetical protein
MVDPYAPCPVYASDPFETEKRMFRLLRLQPNEDEGIIKCEMRTYRHIDNPSYTALSYTWGANRTYADIEINGARVPVRENLWDFLHQQLRHGNHGLFWIDAVCIKQSDINERNDQVQMMGSIYSRAKLVLVWLGRESVYSNIAMQALSNWYWCSPSTAQLLLTMEGKITKRFLARGKNTVTAWSSEETHGILSLCKKRYWSRMWIIQEIMQARCIEIQCGSESLEWYRFAQLYCYLRVDFNINKEMNTPLYNDIRTSPAMSIARMKAQDWTRMNNPSRYKGLPTFDLLLETSIDHECDNVRDKVYGLAGFAKYSEGFVIDYHRSEKDVLVDAFYHVSAQMSWDKCRDEDRLFRVGQLLEKSLKIPFPEPEIQFHTARSRDLAEALVPEERWVRSTSRFFRAVIQAREGTSYLYESAPTQ